jgi:imidazolonepropionase-like amidohydrolase
MEPLIRKNAKRSKASGMGWAQIGELKAGSFADVIAVPGNPISVTQYVSFVMKGGVIYRR